MSRRRAPARGRPTKGGGRGILSLSDDWRVWVVENTLRGVARRELIEALVTNGVPRRTAAREVDAIRSSPALVACQRLSSHVASLSMVAELRQELAKQAPSPASVPRRSGVSADEFYQRYFAANEPIVLTDVMDGWPARERWSFGYFKERFGDVEVEICEGRDGNPLCDRNVDIHKKSVRMSDYIDRVIGAGDTNDFYMVANNRNLEREGLKPLFDDVTPDPAIFDTSRGQGGASLWIGPAGTVTRLHHDTTNVMFCQVVGKKRVRLISPLEISLLRYAEGVFSTLDAEHDFDEGKGLKGVLVKDVELSPGEALFIPVGWWHHVRALAASINFSLLNFRRPNGYTWYMPGARG
jgi:hypothetical protein